MFHQLLRPVGDILALSFIVAALPIVTVLVMLGVLRRPQQHFRWCGVRTVAGDVDRVQRAVAL
jgi:hypothetical protein